MKRRSATRFSSGTLDMPVISKTLPRTRNYRPYKKQDPPADELVKRLNVIGNEYPFCVYFKHKQNDPL